MHRSPLSIWVLSPDPSTIEGVELGQKFVSKGPNGIFQKPHSQNFSQIGRLDAEIWPSDFRDISKCGTFYVKYKMWKKTITRLPVGRFGWNFGWGVIFKFYSLKLAALRPFQLAPAPWDEAGNVRPGKCPNGKCPTGKFQLLWTMVQ